MNGLVYEKTPRRSPPSVWNSRMLAGRRVVDIRQTIPIIRGGPPEAGKCFFDREGHLIFITAGFVQHPESGRVSNHFTWHRVCVNGDLSKHQYSGYWDWGNYKDVIPPRERRKPKKGTG